jgi:hypothetical protein
MVIKSWYKYNESSEQLTREMIVDVIYYRNFTLLSFDEKLSRDIDVFIDQELSDFIDFSSEDTTFINRVEYRQAQEQIDEIYQIAIKNPQIKEKLISLYDQVKKHLGKIGFSDYEEFLIEYLDDGFEIEFLFKPHDCMEIEIKKVIDDISEHVKLIQRAESTTKRISKVCNIPDYVV